jgi:hypothetical protein
MTGVRSPAEEDFFVVIIASMPALQPIQPPVHYVSVAFFPDVKAHGHETSHSASPVRSKERVQLYFH